MHDDEVGQQQQRAGVPWRLLVGVPVVAASLVLAWLAWTHRLEPTAAPIASSTATHDLTADQAACLRFGLIVHRSEAHELTLELGKYSTLDPDASLRLRDEIAELDRVGAEYPTADYRIVGSVADSADASALVLARGHVVTFQSAVAGRSAALARTAALCTDLTGVDTVNLQVPT